MSLQSDIENKILEILSNNQSMGAPLRLANVGTELARAFDNRPFRRLFPPYSLKSFVENFMADRIILRKHPSDDLVFFVELKNATQSGKASTALNTAAPVPAGDRTSAVRPIYDASFWAAFAKPIDDGRTRFLRKVPPFVFRDLSDGEAQPLDHFLIDRDFIAPGSFLPGEERMEFVSKNIDRWLKLNELSRNMFEKLPKPKPRETREEVGHGRTWLRAFESLTQSELERIVIPTDVWLKFIRSL